jgi:hypothetical protein
MFFITGSMAFHLSISGPTTLSTIWNAGISAWPRPIFTSSIWAARMRCWLVAESEVRAKSPTASPAFSMRMAWAARARLWASRAPAVSTSPISTALLPISITESW